MEVLLMNSRKKRICSLLSFALIFSSLGFVSGMENNDRDVKQEVKEDIKPTKQLGEERNPDKCSVISFFNVIPRKGVGVEFSPKATSFDYTVGRLLAITGYVGRNICGDKKGRITDKYTCSIGREIAESTAAALRKGLWNFNEESFVEQKQSAIDNCRYVEMWYRALIFGTNGTDDAIYNFEAGLSDEEKELTEFLRLCRDDCNINTNETANQKKNELLEKNPNVLNLGRKTEEMINEAIQNVLKSLAPKQYTKKSQVIDWERGKIKKKECQFTIFHERMPEWLQTNIFKAFDNDSLGLEENK